MNEEVSAFRLKEHAIESVPKDIEKYIFINQLKPNRFSTSTEVIQQSLHNILDIIEERNAELIRKAEDRNLDLKKLEELISKKKLYEWSMEAT